MDLIARAGREAPFRAGDKIGLNVASGQIHLFREGKRVDL
jgi:hypothetical protein